MGSLFSRKKKKGATSTSISPVSPLANSISGGDEDCNSGTQVMKLRTQSFQAISAIEPPTPDDPPASERKETREKKKTERKGSKVSPFTEHLVVNKAVEENGGEQCDDVDSSHHHFDELEEIAEEYFNQNKELSITMPNYGISDALYNEKAEDEELEDEPQSVVQSFQPLHPSRNETFLENEIRSILEDRSMIHWQKGGLIGGGAYGSVFLGLDLNDGGLMAVKEIALTDSLTEIERSKELESFMQEVRLMKGLRHENIVQFLGVSTNKDCIRIFLEFVPGGSVTSLLQKFGKLKEPLVNVYTKQIVMGLKYLHDNNIIHRDIKGGNILIDKNGVVKLTDFGASCQIGSFLGSRGEDLFNSLKGTPQWMAPEVVRQSGHGMQADIWSLGCTLIEMVTGKPPWAGIGDKVSVLYHVVQDNVSPEIPPYLSTECSDFIKICLNRNPALRPTAEQLLKHPFVVNTRVPKSFAHHSIEYSISEDKSQQINHLRQSIKDNKEVFFSDNAFSAAQYRYQDYDSHHQ